MKFTVLIAHYNNSLYFKDCFKSLTQQVYPHWDAIILDDGSLESEKKAIKAVIEGDRRFKYYENDKNAGVGITKRKLIELATGDICGFVDPDDAILPMAIENCMKVFRNKKRAVLVYSKFMKCDDNLKPLSPFRSAMQVINNDPFFFNYPVQIAHFVAFRKDIYETTEGINNDLKIAEDQDLYLKMYEKGSVYFINDINYLYRTHSGGISQNENREKSHEYFAKVIFNTMKRRNIKSINGKNIPDHYDKAQQIFDLINYQNTILFRIKKKIVIILQKIFA